MYQSTSSSSSSQKSTGPNHGGAGCGLTRYVSAPGSLLSSAVDSVIGRHRDSTTGLRSPPSLAVPYFSSGDSAGESSCKVAHSTSNDPKSASRDLQGSYGPPEFGLGDFSSTINLNGRSGYGGSSSSPSSSLVRQKSSPAGFFNHLTAAPPDSNGFFVTRGTGNYSSLGGHGVGRLKSQLSFTRQDSLSQISEVSENGIDGVSSHAGIQSMSRSFAPTSFGMDSWDSSNSIVFSPPSSKRAKNVDGDIFNCLNGLESQLSLPQTGLEMGMVEKLLQIPEDYVSCKIRAKRGFATHPRSIAERERRTRISGKLKKLQELVPNMDKQTSYADMLDLAVQHIKGLQNQVLNLHNDLENCTCGCKQSKA